MIFANACLFVEYSWAMRLNKHRITETVLGCSLFIDRYAWSQIFPTAACYQLHTVPDPLQPWWTASLLYPTGSLPAPCQLHRRWRPRAPLRWPAGVVILRQSLRLCQPSSWWPRPCPHTLRIWGITRYWCAAISESFGKLANWLHWCCYCCSLLEPAPVCSHTETQHTGGK